MEDEFEHLEDEEYGSGIESENDEIEPDDEGFYEDIFDEDMLCPFDEDDDL